MNRELVPLLPAALQSLKGQDIDALLSRATIVDVPRGVAITRDQEPMDALCLILEGRFAVSIPAPSGDLPLGEAGVGDWIGEVSLFNNTSVATTTVTALVAGRVMVMTHDDFHRLRQEAPTVAGLITRLLVTLMASRLRNSARALELMIEAGAGAARADEIPPSRARTALASLNAR